MQSKLQELTEKISLNNNLLVNYYIKGFYKVFTNKVSSLFRDSCKDKYNKEMFISEVNGVYSKILVMVIENVGIFKVRMK